MKTIIIICIFMAVTASVFGEDEPKKTEKRGVLGLGYGGYGLGHGGYGGYGGYGHGLGGYYGGLGGLGGLGGYHGGLAPLGGYHGYGLHDAGYHAPIAHSIPTIHAAPIAHHGLYGGYGGLGHGW